MTAPRFNCWTDAVAAPWSRWATLGGAARLVATVAAGANTASGRSLRATPASATTAFMTQVLGQLQPPHAPGQTLSLRSLAAHSHPGSTFCRIESGAIAFSLVAGEGRPVRGASGGATPSAGEALAAGMEITATAGNVITVGASVAQTEQAMGDAPLAIMLTNLAPTGAPFRSALAARPAA